MPDHQTTPPPPSEETLTTRPAPDDEGPISLFERLARDPTVDVEKLDRLIAMHERVLAMAATAAFNRAYAQMQAELPQITEHGQILVKGQVRSTYARLEDIQAATVPVLKVYGFALRFRTEWPAPGVIRIVGILTHEQGHHEESTFEAPLDDSDFRTEIQSRGSTVSYGRRYTTLDLLNIATRGQDDDGETSTTVPEIPMGYADWLLDLEVVASEGTSRLKATWAKSKPEYRDLLVTYSKTKWEALKKMAATVKA